jgi:hypothetical protein
MGVSQIGVYPSGHWGEPNQLIVGRRLAYRFQSGETSANALSRDLVNGTAVQRLGDNTPKWGAEGASVRTTGSKDRGSFSCRIVLRSMSRTVLEGHKQIS